MYTLKNNPKNTWEWSLTDDKTGENLFDKLHVLSLSLNAVACEYPTLTLACSTGDIDIDLELENDSITIQDSLDENT